CDLAVVGWAKAAIGHLHDPRLRVCRGSTRFGALASLLPVVPVLAATARAMRFDLGKLLESSRNTRLAFTGRTVLGGSDAPVAGVGVVVILLPQVLDQTPGLLQLLMQ